MGGFERAVLRASDRPRRAENMSWSQAQSQGHSGWQQHPFQTQAFDFHLVPVFSLFRFRVLLKWVILPQNFGENLFVTDVYAECPIILELIGLEILRNQCLSRLFVLKNWPHCRADNVKTAGVTWSFIRMIRMIRIKFRRLSYVCTSFKDELRNTIIACAAYMRKVLGLGFEEEIRRIGWYVTLP